MKTFLFALLIAFCTISASAQQLTPKDIFLKTQQELLKHDRVAYTATSRFKFFNYDDTISTKINAELIRHTNDTLFGGKIYFMANDTLARLYDLENIYWINSKRQTATKFDAHNGDEWAISGGVPGDAIWNDFLKPERFVKRIDNQPVLLKDTVVDGKLCYQIQTTRPDDAEYSDKKAWFYIAKDSFTPILVKSHIRFQDNYQYSEFNIHSLSFKNPLDISLNQKITPSYAVEKFIRPEQEGNRTLAVGTSAPKLWGNDFHRNIHNDTINFSGKVTVMDFWYMSCYPCIKAIPHMEELFKKYSARGLQVVGVNAFDNNEKALKKLPQFLKKQPD